MRGKLGNPNEVWGAKSGPRIPSPYDIYTHIQTDLPFLPFPVFRRVAASINAKGVG
jgi:hypothetical protein